MIWILQLVLAWAHADCEMNITKTIWPVDGQVFHQDLCINNYFLKHDLANKSILEDKNGNPVIANDVEDLVFDDWLLFGSPINKPLEEAGRLQLIHTLYKSYQQSLRTTDGVCELKIYGNQKELSINDFIKSDRNEEGQPGTRLSLTKDDVQNPSWELWCIDKEKSKSLIKKGNYFFIFIDVIENQSIKNSPDHFSKFLFAFR